MQRRSIRWLVAYSLACMAALVSLALVTRPAKSARGAEPVSFQDLEESLTCQCGCGLTVHSCNHLQCPSAIPLRDELRAQIDAGKEKPAILTYFSGKYGEKILSSPTTSGFNLVAWITPFVVVALGAVFLGVALMRWSARGRVAPVPVSEKPGNAPAASPYGKILEKELKEFDG